MARNTQRDARDNERRRNQLLEAGFKLFSENDIETISLQKIADEADVGIATVYNYYGSKANLVIAISGKIWKEYWEEVAAKNNINPKDTFRNCYQMVELYLNCICQLYKERPDVLRFSSNYKTYICREKVESNQLGVHLDTLMPMRQIFHIKYEEAKTDHSVRTDIPEDKLFSIVCMSMLAMAERYAQGIVWTRGESEDYGWELERIKEMILDYVKPRDQAGIID